jgi:N-acetylneuraminic acid mutarotase
MPEARSGAGTAALDGILYVAGGSLRRDIFAYDPHADQWRTVGRLRHPVDRPGVAALRGRLYVVGGWDELTFSGGRGSSDLQILDPATGRVEAGPPMPTPRGGVAVAVLDGRLHTIGGSNDTVVDSFQAHEVFDPSTGAWSRRASPPIGGDGVAAATLGGKIYLVGHGDGQLHVYDPATNSWTTHDVPLHQAGAAAVALAGGLYVLGGQDPQFHLSDIVYRFDPETGTWGQMTPMLSPRIFPAVDVVGKSIYVISGWPGYTLNERYRLE